MHASRPLARRHPSFRGGFTLLELMVVIIVIALLAALLFPAIQRSIRTVKEATVVTEMSNFDRSLTEFKSRYGVDVPSFIVLYEQGEAVGSTSCWGSDTASALPAPQDNYRRTSRAFLRQVWPDFDFASLGDSAASPMPAGPGNPTAGNSSVDLNGDGDEADVLILNGSECLVFFLGGIVRRGGTNFPSGTSIVDSMKDDAFIGFATNPQNPFSPVSTNNRVGPLFPDFLVDRMTDVDNDGLPEYRDGLAGQQRPYIYVSSYGGAGYKVAGLNTGAGITIDDEIPTDASGTPLMTDAYRKDDNAPGFGTEPYFNPQSYQLISPGTDTDLGPGGEYDGNAIDATGAAANRAVERDNITNFKGGRLN